MHGSAMQRLPRKNWRAIVLQKTWRCGKNAHVQLYISICVHDVLQSLDLITGKEFSRNFFWGRDPGPTRYIVLANMLVFSFSTLKNLGYIGRGVLLNRENHPPFTCLTLLSHPGQQDPPQLGRDPGPTRHIVLVILLVLPFSILKPGIYWVRGTVEQGEPPSLYPS